MKIYLLKNTGGSDFPDAYYVSNLSNLNWSVDTPVTPMPLPEDTHEENILVKMEGNTAKVDLSWTLDEGDYFGRLNGTTWTGNGSKTVLQQIKDFKDFVPKSIGDAYILRITDDNNIMKMEDEGTISNMSFSVSGGSPIVWNVNLAFYVGRVVAMLEADIPPAPTSLTLTGASGAINFTYVAYDGYGDDPTGASIPTKLLIKIKQKSGLQWNGAGGTDDKATNTWEPIVASGSERTIANYTADATGARQISGGSFNSGVLRAGTYEVKIAELNGYSADASQEYYRKGATSTTSTVTVT
jgi:hypothetical protein|tara:strand:- start:135 stop:1028 length:894 start_codon:yes stop_codon:yes gene_type:complete